MAVLKADHTRPEAEKRVRLDTHSEDLGHDKMAKLVDIYRHAEYEENC